MDNSFQTSFIPKKPIASNSSSKTPRPPTSLLTVLAFFILILVGVSSVGLFLYKNYLIKEEAGLSDSLQKASGNFEKDTINELELYDKRVAASKEILSGHIVLSPMFALIGNLTIPSVQYTDFTQDTTGDGFSVKMSGIAQDYKSVALQADVFNTAKARSFKNVVFSNLTKDKNNKVNFDVEFTVDPDLLSYQKDLEQQKIQTDINSTTPVPAAEPASTSTSVSQPTTTTPTANGALNGGVQVPASTNNTNSGQSQ